MDNKEQLDVDSSNKPDTEKLNVTIYTGISCLNSGTDKAIVSIVLYCMENPDETIAEVFEPGVYTHQKAELYAVKKATEVFDGKDRSLIICSRSNYVYSFVTKYRDLVLKNDYDSVSKLSICNADIIKQILFTFIHRSKISNGIEVRVSDMESEYSRTARRIATINIKSFVNKKNSSSAD